MCPDPALSRRPLDAVCFDLDSTLCVSTTDDAAIHEAVFERVDVEPFFEPADVRAVDPASLPPADSRVDHWEHLYRRLAADFGADPSVAPALAEATLEAFDPTAVEFRAGAEAALTYASDRYAVGLLTQGEEDPQTEKLEALGIADAFDARVFCGPGTDIPGKPAREPFDRLLEALGVASDRAVYVGDSLRGDVAGARRAGMAAVWVPRGTPSDPGSHSEATPTRQLASPRELPAIL